ncbi:hypothetical protein AXG93_3337s1130 [Marchantia polymorpha subsp. ruderalis]|uniref:Integrase zinc-binding domain-containing protein n=1 Tax=Marchantia polymorpha subsp. ruderalis TaxID=1480154 RepID=A0A176W3P5_MARPO|nr:hypothetical protein AXG93_3337s1130 [Marchantia polymorpha subsp. ruderalis]
MVPGRVGAKEGDRVLQRAKRSRLEGSHVLRVWENGRIRVVPHPAQRARIVRHAHEELEHFGVKRTYSLLLGQYWWRGMHTQIRGWSFSVLCDKALIDLHTMSRDHREADGLAERVVQTMKSTLRKYDLQKGHLGNWDIQLPWLAMGYRFSRQASLASFSPYFLLYGRDLDLPTSIRRESSKVMSLDDPNMWMRRRRSFVEKSSVGLTRTEEFSYGPLLSSGRHGTNGWKTTDYIDPKRRAIALRVMHILRPARTMYVTAWQVKFFERILKVQGVHWARIFHDLVWVNATDRCTGPLVNHLTPFLVIFFQGMGLLTREKERRFPKEREILTAESSEGTKDETCRPSIPPQTTARRPVQVEVVRRREKPERRVAKRRRVVNDDEGDLALRVRRTETEVDVIR